MNPEELAAAQAAYDRGDILEMPEAVKVEVPAEPNPVTGEAPAADAADTTAADAEAEAEVVEGEGEADGEAVEAKTDEPARGEDGKFAKADKRGEPRVPKSRLDEALRRGNELQARLDALEQQKAERVAADPSPAQLDALEESYSEAVLEGDKTRARELRSQIRAIEREQYQADLSHERSVIASQAELQRIVGETVSAIETSYPELNPDAPEFNEAASASASSLMQAFVATGQYSQVAAMREAARVAALQHGLSDRQHALVAPAAKPDPAAARTKQAVAKNAAAASMQPPAQRAGVDSDALGGALTAAAVAKMSSKEFDALSEAQKAAIRGDVV